MGRLDGVRIKIDRARHHIGTLREALDPIGELATRSITAQREDQRVVYRVTRTPAIAAAHSATVGEVLYNARSALDHLAWQLVELDGGAPDESTQFPLLPARADKRGRRRGVQLVPRVMRADIVDALERVQPYQETDPWDHDLYVLNKLCNIDKHRLLLTMTTGLDWEGFGPYWGDLDGFEVVAWKFNTGVPLEEGDEVAWLGYSGPAPDPADVELHMRLAPALGEGPDDHRLRRQAVVDSLDGLVGFVSFVINLHFLPLFAGESPIALTSQ